MAKTVMMMMLALVLSTAVIVSGGRPVSHPYVLQGRVYCDTCRAGFETSATTYIPKYNVLNGSEHEAAQYFSIDTDGSGGQFKIQLWTGEHPLCRKLLVETMFCTSLAMFVGVGAKVRVECKDKKQKVIFTKEGTTDATGTYYIHVNEDHGDETCDVVLVSSPLGDCKTADPGRDRARVVLTSYNGIVSDSRFANAMGFMKDDIMSGCTMLLQSLMEEEN
ncbi:protein downstream of FLC [Tanacetum coccineum]